MFIRRKTHEALLKDIQQEARGMGALAAKYKAERNTALADLTAARAEAEANKADAKLWRNARERRKQGRAAVKYARIAEVAAGSILIADDGFDCIDSGVELTVEQDEHGLFVRCDDGAHYIDGQMERGVYVGLSLAPATPQSQAA